MKLKENTLDNPWITMNEAVKYSKFSRRTIERDMEKGLVKRTKSGGVLRFKKNDIDAYVRNR